MDNNREATTITTVAARAGSEERVVRYVLGTSLSLTILALSVTWISAALAIA